MDIAWQNRFDCYGCSKWCCFELGATIKANDQIAAYAKQMDTVRYDRDAALRAYNEQVQQINFERKKQQRMSLFDLFEKDQAPTLLLTIDKWEQASIEDWKRLEKASR